MRTKTRNLCIGVTIIFILAGIGGIFIPTIEDNGAGIMEINSTRQTQKTILLVIASFGVPITIAVFFLLDRKGIFDLYNASVNLETWCNTNGLNKALSVKQTDERLNGIHPGLFIDSKNRNLDFIYSREKTIKTKNESYTVQECLVRLRIFRGSGENRTESINDLAIIHSPSLDLPNFRIAKKNILNRISMILFRDKHFCLEDYHGIQISAQNNPEFNKKFFVLHDEGTPAADLHKSVLSPDMITTWIENIPIFPIQGSGNTIAICHTNKYGIKDPNLSLLPHLLEYLEKIVPILSEKKKI